jgi:heptosyltransferase III
MLDAGRWKEVKEKLSSDAIIHVFPDKEICKLAKKAGIPQRISTSHRIYSWLYCNKLVHYSRKKSNLHEAQLNMKLLEPLGISKEYSLAEIGNLYGLTQIGEILNPASSIQHPGSVCRLILHPKSKGSAREWGLDNYSKLIGMLPDDKFKIFITGTKEEGWQMQDFLAHHKNRITDMTGKLSLEELITFINDCDGLVAASTGPLHIAAALGKRAIGLYAPMRPIFPKRWAPIGKNADYLVLDKECTRCRKTMDCECIRNIPPEAVAEQILRY